MNDTLKNVLLVINPVAGDTDKQPIIDLVRDYLRPKGKLKLFRTTGKDDAANLHKEIQSFRPDRILVAGGDGTVKMVAQACDGARYVLGILPAGSANGLATDLGLPQDCGKAIVTAMGETTVRMDALRIGDSIGLHISDLGINAELIKNYSDAAVRGRFGYVLSSIPTLRETRTPYHFTISANGEERKVEGIMVAFANSKKFGTGALVNPHGQIDDGRFEVLVFKKLDVLEILKTLRGDIDLDTDFVVVIQTTQAQVTTLEPVSFQIDGEPRGEVTQVSVSIIPGFVEIANDV
ncbi:diacylglycerol kinase family protein [Pricia sp. S334]|uniref:Diacylglycerol kinase family protein n=1 Tax=Pricia mediterranea TaxID=3076079 RepID=A0ABU3L207_9FLAO|nr:diacylglycerol kinase family protein [Pricia sp. S334]MDT7827771.1 diacylglycerol kinase family protein [Pricia sp. S334]